MTSALSAPVCNRKFTVHSLESELEKLLQAPQSGQVGFSAGRVEHSKINENEHVRQDRAREAKPENIKHMMSAGTLAGVILRNQDRRLRSAMRALGDTCGDRIERGIIGLSVPSPTAQ
jgi:hypothetical protein